jgi:hypothetical protein
MALSARTPTTATNATYFWIASVYSNEVIDAAKKNLVCVDAVNTEWLKNAKLGDTYYIPKTNVVSAAEIVVGTKTTATNPLTTAGVTVSIDTWYEAPVDIDDMTMLQAGADVSGIAATEAAYAIKVKADTVVATLFSGLGTVYGSDGQTLTDDILIYAMETLDEADVPQDGKRSLVLDPSGVADMMKIDKFIMQQYANNVGAVSNGIIGRSPVYGCTVRVTNNLVTATTGSYACMLHPKAIACKIQVQNPWTEVYKSLHQTRFSCDLLMGAAEAQDAFGVNFYSRKA